jgi:hypothetical protein
MNGPRSTFHFLICTALRRLMNSAKATFRTLQTWRSLRTCRGILQALPRPVAFLSTMDL